MKFKSVTITFLLFSFLISAAQESEAWKLLKDEDGIQVYSKPDIYSDMKIIKAETVAKTTLSTLITLIRDAENHQNWVFNCTHAEILELIDSTDWYYYAQTDAPWPVSDRDVVTKVTFYQDKDTKTVTFKSTGVPDYIPQKPGYIRIPETESYWIFEPLDNRKINIIFKLKINLGGSIPQWLTNMVIAKGPYNTIRNMLFEIEKPRYKYAYCEFIEE